MVVTTNSRRSRVAAVIAVGTSVLALLASCATGGGPAAADRIGAAPSAARSAVRAGAGHAGTSRASHAGQTGPRRQTDVSGVAQAGWTAPAQPGSASPAASSAAGGPAAAAGQAAAVVNGPRRVTFINRVRQTVWVAAAPDAQHPLARTGWMLRPGHRVTITVPNRWNGRFWGRTGCAFRHGRGHCATGDCGGMFQCAGWGAIPATLAEYNLDAWHNLDFYDVSLVDGSNLPMYIYPTSGHAAKKVSRDGCVAAGCTRNVRCPSALRIYSGGRYVACESACAKLGGDQYCCRGKWAPRPDCNPAKWPVDYARVFKRAEPYAYSYVDDDATSVYVCSGRCDYTIVFGITPRK